MLSGTERLGLKLNRIIFQSNDDERVLRMYLMGLDVAEWISFVLSIMVLY